MSKMDLVKLGEAIHDLAITASTELPKSVYVKHGAELQGKSSRCESLRQLHPLPEQHLIANSPKSLVEKK
jgi:hypothetical protein